MRAVIAEKPGGVDVLRIVELPEPSIRPEQILVRNFAAALNRADLLQRRGLYPPPEGESEILGLEFAGEVAAVGEEVQRFCRGDRVFGLVSGGACADFLAVDARLAIPVADTLSFEAAAALPEAFFTAGEGLFTLARLREGECLLVHAGASGVGSAALQLGRHVGARVLATTGSAEKAERCLELGASRAVNYRREDFYAVVAEETGGRGADVILDLVGAAYWDRNLASLRAGGRWLVLGLLGGSRPSLDLAKLIQRRIQLLGDSLRHRPLQEKIEVTGRFVERVLPLVESGRVRPVIDSVLPLEEVRDAHARMEANRNVGKIILRL